MILTVKTAGLTIIVVYRWSSFFTTQLHLTPQPQRLRQQHHLMYVELCSVRENQVTYLIYMVSKRILEIRRWNLWALLFRVTKKAIRSDKSASREDILLTFWLAA